MSRATLPKILCVDDEAGLLHALERQFKNEFEVLTAPSAKDGLKLLSRHADVAVVLSDYQMPDGNGLDFLREVRKLHPCAARAVLSGQMDLGRVSEAINRADIHKFILKPWENAYLTLQMLEALQVHHALKDRAHFERLALTDPVTRVGNHRAFQEFLRAALEAEPASLALILFDVDNFKGFNDRFGHPRGDELLRHVADRLTARLESRGHVARYGGEEFTVVLPHADLDQARTFAEGVRAEFAADPALATLSAGLAVSPEDATAAPALIARADEALYRAKAAGRNRVFTSRDK